MVQCILKILKKHDTREDRFNHFFTLHEAQSVSIIIIIISLFRNDLSYKVTYK